MDSEELQHLADLEHADYLRGKEIEETFRYAFEQGRNPSLTVEDAWQEFNQ